MLLMIQFIFHLFALCDASHAWYIQLSTYHQSLLQYIKEHQQYTNYFLKTTLNAYWDMVQAIVAMFESMSIIRHPNRLPSTVAAQM